MKKALNTLLTFSILAWASIAQGGVITGKVQGSDGVDISNTVVYLEGVKGRYPVPKKHPQMDHVDQQFVPRTLAVYRGTTVDFANSDNVFHSAFSISNSNPFDLGIYGPGHAKNMTFRKPGLVEIFCHIHDHMYAYVLVLKNPFFSTLSKDGSFTIRDVPAGTYTVRAWSNPKLQNTGKVTVREAEKASVNIKLAPR
jgi:plastocyanin